MNKALEQKLIGPMEESHTKEQSPKAVLWEVLWARRSKIAAKWARTRAWAGWWFFGRKKKCVGARISGGEPPWAHEAGGAPWTLVSRCWLPLMCSQCYIFSNIPEKIILNFQGIWRTFIFEVFLYCTDNQITDRKIFIFILFNINNRK